jgi:hypothetical protein
MSDRLSLPPSYYDAPASTTGAGEPLSWRSTALRSGFLLALFAGAGVGGGYAWRHLWTPPVGEAVDGSWVPTPVEEGLQGDFSGVGWYVVVALVLGLLLGLAAALVLGRAEIVAVAVVVVGSALAAYLLLSTGERLSPPDPDRAAAAAEDGTVIRGDLEFDGMTPLLSLPIGALASVTGVFLLTNGRDRGQQGLYDYLAGSHSSQI